MTSVELYEDERFRDARLPDERFFAAPFLEELGLRGTLAPFSRASDNPIAIACLRLFTVPPLPPLPLLSVPFFLRRIALATVLFAAFPYLRPLDFFAAFFVATIPPGCV